MNGKTALGVGIAAIAILVLASRAKASDQYDYVCTIDGQIFDTQQQLIDHYATAHPGERVPIIIRWD
jgi:hypothetical protein